MERITVELRIEVSLRDLSVLYVNNSDSFSQAITTRSNRYVAIVR